MLEYLPWSRQTLDYCVDAHSKKKVPSLDLEFSSICTGANCIYCDSKPFVGPKMRNELSMDSMMVLLEKCKNKGLKWIYTCGLGEPTEDDKFWSALSFAKENEIVISFFSNGVFISKEMAKRLKDAGACIILKMDTFEMKAFDTILGGTGRAIKVYEALDNLLSAGFGGNEDYTDFAFSIVPTSLSLSGIPEVIRFAIKHGIFPSVGELEKSGSSSNYSVFDKLFIDDNKLQRIKELLDSHFNGNYKRPICPAIVTGLHFNNLGECIVDRETGLNCKWFMLKEPTVSSIGNYRDNLDVLLEKTNNLRREFFLKNNDMYFGNHVFGGCGGNTEVVFQLAQKCLY